jgi:hypothetical protein
MNGKLARAIRRGRKERETGKPVMTKLDRERLIRQVQKAELSERYQPKPLVVREHKGTDLRPMGKSAWKRKGPLILINPVYQLKAKIFKTLGRNPVDGTIDPLSSMQKALLRSAPTSPKHWLDRVGV